MMVKISKATISDCKVCWKMSDVRELLPPGRKHPQLWWMEAFVRERKTFLVAKQGKNIVGFVFGEGLAGRVSIVHVLYVEKKYRNAGIGRALLKAFETERKRKGHRVVISYVGKGKALGFFRKHNYASGSVLTECEKVI